MKFNPFGKRALDIGAGIGKMHDINGSCGMDAYGFEPAREFNEIGISNIKFPKKGFCTTLDDAVYLEEHFDLISFGSCS